MRIRKNESTKTTSNNDSNESIDGTVCETVLQAAVLERVVCPLLLTPGPPTHLKQSSTVSFGPFEEAGGCAAVATKEGPPKIQV